MGIVVGNSQRMQIIVGVGVGLSLQGFPMQWKFRVGLGGGFVCAYWLDRVACCARYIVIGIDARK